MTPDHPLERFQADFWHDLWAAPGTPPRGPWASHPGFAVHRHTVWSGVLETLRAQYPAVRRLCGDDFLDDVGREHLREQPPRDGRLMAYGEGFADTLAEVLVRRGLADRWPWLSAVARVDRAWTECHLAPPAPLAGSAWLARLAAEGDLALDQVRLRPHPAARWCGDGRWPLHALWRAAREADADPVPPVWRGETVLLTRPGRSVVATALDAPATALLNACARGASLAGALAAAAAADSPAADPPADPGACLGRLLACGAFLDPGEPAPAHA